MPALIEEVTILELLELAAQRRASDLHLAAGLPPLVRVDGRLLALDYEPLTPNECQRIVYDILTDRQIGVFEDTHELDLSYGVPNLGRYRVNVYMQRSAVGAALRLIPSEIPSLEALALPRIVHELAEGTSGLVLVTGPTGSGKSTTLAAMLDKVNNERNEHILTIEDPIEYIHPHKGCIVNQREVHADTEGFAPALRAALREDPDVVLIGEMRDLQTVEAALRIAETGHLTFATLHTNSAAQTINRIVDIFPAHQQSQIRTQLSLVLEGIICQSLLSKANGPGRVIALEILVPTPAIRNLIREDKIHQIYSAMQAGQEKVGMQTFNQSLATLYLQRKISMNTALSASSLKDELTEMISRGAGVVAGAGLRRPGVPQPPGRQGR